MNTRQTLKYLLLAVLILPISPSWAQEAGEKDEEITVLEPIVVLGSRVPGRSAQDSPVPVDVIEGTTFRNYGVRDMDSLLSQTVPSYNVNQQPISDAGTLVRPANLRGLPPDSTLILVNGKRRHRASVITFLGGGISDGSQAPDLAPIPAIALKRVEVLRDGAAAQYGSDAVAGVMNFVLKDAPDSGTVETRWGQFYKGDGDTYSIAGNIGLPIPLPPTIAESGFANFSFEYGQADPTSRSVQRDDAQGLIDAGNNAVRQPAAQIWGAPEFHYDYKLFGNMGLDLGKSEVYAFGNYAQRKVEGGFFFRNPHTRGGIFNEPIRWNDDTLSRNNRILRFQEQIAKKATQEERKRITESNAMRMATISERLPILVDMYNDQAENIHQAFENVSNAFNGTKEEYDKAKNDFIKAGIEGGWLYDSIKVADLTGGGNCPEVRIDKDDKLDQAALDALANNPDCFAFNQRFPGGFTPTFGGVVKDWSAAVGIRGDTSHNNVWLDEWHYDLSAVFGQHSTDFFMTNTINPQLAGLRTNIPTNYNPGGYVERDRVINLDLSRPLDTKVFYSPLNLALGLEYRQEEFEVEAGERNSWVINDNLAAQGFGIGSNGFPGFSPKTASKNNRGSYAAYLDMETDVVKDVLVGVAARFEEYETFGDTLNGKVNARWQATSNVALRGSLSTGFRAPTVGQANVRNVTTEFVGNQLADRATLPPTHPAAVDQGAKPLKPEKSFNLTAGTVLNIGKLAVTIDYYRVKVQDRIGQTGNLDLCPVAGEALALSDSRCTNVRERLEAQGVSDASSFTSVRFFTNDFDTTTQGIDVVATYPMDISGWDTLYTFAGNWNQTKVTEFNPDLISYKRRIQLEENLPNFRFTLTADHQRGPWRLLTRFYYYDDFVEFHVNSNDYRIEPSERLFVDLEGSYTFKLGITVAAGAQNLFDTYPSQNQYAGKTGSRYPESSPYGFNGGFYYFRALYAF